MTRFQYIETFLSITPSARRENEMHTNSIAIWTMRIELINIFWKKIIIPFNYDHSNQQESNLHILNQQFSTLPLSYNYNTIPLPLTTLIALDSTLYFKPPVQSKYHRLTIQLLGNYTIDYYIHTTVPKHTILGQDTSALGH